MRKSLFARWRSNFLTGLAVVLPGIITLAVVKWLFGTISSFTDLLLFFLPHWVRPEHIYTDGVSGAMFWYWSLLAFVIATVLISAIGILARYYFGKRLIELADNLMLRVPLLNKIYGTIKQIDQAFTSNKNGSFKTVVLIEYPREGIYTVGFITRERTEEFEAKTGKKCACVFVPLPPVPTAGFLLLMPEEKIIPLDMSVADGLKYVISIGTISQESSVTNRKRPQESDLAMP